MQRMSRSLSLELSRLRRARGAPDASRYGLVWVTPVSMVDESALREGDRVVRDFVIVDGASCPAIAESRERLARDGDDRGSVFSPDGRLIGAVRGHFLSFEWPADLVAGA